MKIHEFKKPAPIEPTLEESLSNEFDDYCRPRKIYIPPAALKPVDELTQEIADEFNLYEDGRIVKGSNTTDDVGVDEIIIQAKKMGFDVTRDGVPAYLDTHGKSYKPVVVEFTKKQIKEDEIYNYIKQRHDDYNISSPPQHVVPGIRRLTHTRINESIEHNEIQSLIKYITKHESIEQIKVGDYFAILDFEFSFGRRAIDILKFEEAKKVIHIEQDANNKIKFIKFEDGSQYPKSIPALLNNKPIEYTIYFDDQSLADQALTSIVLKIPDNWEYTITSIPTAIKEETEELTEINMGSKNLQKQIDKLYDVVTPIIGFEMEMCKQPSNEIQNDIQIDSTMDVYDLAQFFNNNDEEDFEKLTLPYAKWIKKQDPQFADEIWTHDKIVQANGMGDRNLSFGAFLNANDYHSAMNLFFDNQDWLEEPYDEDGDGTYNFGEAKATAEEMDDYGIDAEVEETYHSGNRPDDAWVIEPDDSIRPNPGDVGMEIISPPQDYNDGLLQFQDMCAMMRDSNYYTNESTGLHINVSIDGIGFSGLDYTKLVLLSGDSHVLQQFDRGMNNYTNHALRELSDYFKPDGVGQAKEQGERKIELLIKAMKVGFDKVGKELIGNISLNGHVSIAIKPGYIEFRSAGDTDYEYNDQAIIDAVNRFIVAFVAATDVDLYRKEYAKKLYKVLSAHLPASNDKLNQHAMQLFAMHKSGMFDQNRLKEKLKDLGQQRQKIKEPVPKDTVEKIGQDNEN